MAIIICAKCGCKTDTIFAMALHFLTDHFGVDIGIATADTNMLRCELTILSTMQEYTVGVHNVSDFS